jgi:hypothetical protein
MNNSDYLDYFSVEPIPGNNASALFLPKLREVFREDSEPGTLTVDGMEYVPWGSDDSMPYDIIDLIESDETLSTCQIFNAEVCYGAGLNYNTEDATVDTRRAVTEFMINNAMPDYFLGMCQDMKHFNFAITVVLLNADGDRIVGLVRKPACYCRFAPADSLGHLTRVIFGPFRRSMPSDPYEAIDLLDTRAPLLDLMMRTGRRTRLDGTTRDDGVRKYAILSRFPGVDSLYYPIPHYASLFRGSWFKIKQLIGKAKLAKLQNAAPIKYVIEVSPRYWETVFQDLHVVNLEERRKIVKERKLEMMKFLTNTDNSGSVLFTGKSLSVDGRNENPDISVTSIDSKTKEGGDWESDIAEAVNMVCFTMRVHSNLVGSVPGKTQTNNSGSDKRELYTIAHALQKPYHDILLLVHHLIISFNGWEGVRPECPFLQLTTLDEHRDAKQVTTNDPYTHEPSY